MARLKNLPSLEIIKGFKGVIDFAITRGVPYARSWPHTPRSHFTAASLVTAAIFGEVVSAFRLLAPELLEAIREDAADQPRSERDIYVQATYGYLHENRMSDILDLLTAIDGHLVDLQTILALEAGGNLAAMATALDVDLSTRALEAGGNLEAILAQLDVELSTRALEAGGNLEDILTSLQIIDGFSLATNKLFGYNNTYHERLDTTTTAAGDNRWVATVVPPGEVWVITAFQGYNATTATGIMHCGKWDGTYEYVVRDTRYYTPTRIIDWQGRLVLKAGEYPYIMYGSCALNDRRIGRIVGYKMKVA